MTAISVGGSSESGLRWPNYVNGRLLTAEDLEVGQDATFIRDGWLGLAIGSGVVSGLEVDGAPGSTTLAVSPGVGVSRHGTAIRLESPVSFNLAEAASLPPPDGSRFADCLPGQAAVKAPTAGAYLLSVCPRTWLDGKVPVQGAEGSQPKACVSRWEVAGVVFKVVRLGGFTTSTTAANRRNLLAHWCFGSGRLGPLAMGGFTSGEPHRGIDRIDPADLGPCDLPLAVFDWNGSNLAFVDLWSARRRPVRPSAETRPVGIGGRIVLGAHGLVGDERPADGESRFLQFQDQAAALTVPPGGTTVSAQESFPLLPPAGLLPISGAATAALLRSLLQVGQGIVDMASTPKGDGYWLVSAQGGIFAFGKARYLGSPKQVPADEPIAGMARTPSGDGYWLVSSRGGIFSFGDAKFLGSLGGLPLNRPIVGMAGTRSGNGYWLAAADGGVFAFGDAPFFGSTGSPAFKQPITGMAPAPASSGYWLVSSVGETFPFGSAHVLGAMGGLPPDPQIVGMAVTPTGEGHLLVSAGGSVFASGDARFLGAAAVTAGPLADRILMLSKLFEDSSATGLDLRRFFAGVNVRLGVMGPDPVDSTVRRSWLDEAIPIGANPDVEVGLVLDDSEKAVAPYALFCRTAKEIEWLTQGGLLPS